MIEIRHAEIDESQDSQRSYDTLYREHGIGQTDSFYLWILSLLRAKPGQSLLDISCGEGALVAFAERVGFRAYGFDFSRGALDLASRRNAGAVWIADAERIPLPDGQFDHVVNIGSLEHYMNMETSIRESVRVLRPDGWACYLLPNAFSLFGNIKHVWQTGEVFDDGQPLQRYNTRTGWQRLLEANGLSVKRVAKYELVWPRTWPDVIRYLRRPLRLLRLLASPLIPTNMANCIVYLCQRKGTKLVGSR